MASVITTEWLEARIAAKQVAIVAYEAAILALASGAQTYSLDTGQTRQTVTKANLTEMRKTLAELNAELEALDRQVNGATPTYGRPCW